MKTKYVAIIMAIVVIIVVGACAIVCITDANEVKYTNVTFDEFSASVPEGCHFKNVDLSGFGLEYSNVQIGDEFIKTSAYKNIGNYSDNISGILFVNSSSNFDNNNNNSDRGNSSYEDNPGFDAFFNYLIGDYESINGTQKIYENTSTIIIWGENTTKGPLFKAKLFIGTQDNFNGFIGISGNDLDVVTNVAHSIQF